MKRNHIILSTVAGAVMLLSACSSSDAPSLSPQEYISFGVPDVSFTGIVSSSRSTLISSENPLKEFTVAGFCVPRTISGSTDPDYASATASWNDKSAYSKADVFDGSTVNVNIDGDATEYSPVKKWIETGGIDSWNAKYSFIAWANAGEGKFTPSVTSYAVPTVVYEMPFSGGSTSNRPTYEHNRVTDAVIASTFDHTRRQGKVNLRFEHILTGISFRFRNYTSKKLTITGLSLDGHFYRKVGMSFATDKMKQSVESLDNNGGYWATFEIVKADKPVDVQPNSSLMLTHTDGSQLTILLLPNPDVDPTNTTLDKKDQYALGSNKNIVVRYRLEGDAADRESRIDDFHLSYNPAQSTRHTATLNFIGDEFTLIFQAMNDDVWENGSDSDIQIN